jgi:hypothetical protein
VVREHHQAAVPQRYAANANFAAQNYNNWQSLGAFGNSTMYVDKFDNRWHGGGRGLRYKSVPFGETFYGENHQGKVDRMIRWFRLTAYQAVQKWGLDGCRKTCARRCSRTARPPSTSCIACGRAARTTIPKRWTSARCRSRPTTFRSRAAA